MQFLKIKRRATRKRADGTSFADASFVTKRRKFGETLSEETVSKKRSLLVTGAHDSGKTRWIRRLYDEAPQIWGSKAKATPLLLESFSPLVAWCEQPCVAEWWDIKYHAEQKQEPVPDTARVPWKSLKQHSRVEALTDYCQDTGAVVFVDDIHKLSGRKLQIARQCLVAARLFVVTASEEQRIPPNLRMVVLRREPQIFRLDSEVSYDATNLFMWSFLAMCLVGGWYEAAFVLGSLKALGGGRRAARAD